MSWAYSNVKVQMLGILAYGFWGLGAVETKKETLNKVVCW
jgi:hypothetical protein